MTSVASRPINSTPTTPPTKCTPTTSSESSNPNRNFSPIANEQTIPASRHTITAPRVFTVPQDGVMATRPATTPEAAPNVVGLPSRICSTVSQPSIPRQPATSVLRKIAAAVPLAAIAEPALNPNQPNHSRPTPS